MAENKGAASSVVYTAAGVVPVWVCSPHFGALPSTRTGIPWSEGFPSLSVLLWRAGLLWRLTFSPPAAPASDQEEKHINPQPPFSLGWDRSRCMGLWVCLYKDLNEAGTQAHTVKQEPRLTQPGRNPGSHSQKGSQAHTVRQWQRRTWHTVVPPDNQALCAVLLGPHTLGKSNFKEDFACKFVPNC